MKVIAIAVLCVIQVSICHGDEDYEQLLETSIAECAAENEIDVKIVEKVWNEPEFPANNGPLKCFYHCLNVKLGVTDENENLDDDSLKKLFAHYGKSTESVEVGGDCKTVEASDGDLCETAYAVIKCVAEFQLNK